MINGDTYNEKEAVLEYVASLKNKSDLMDGDHSCFLPPFDGKLSKAADKLEEEKRYFFNARFQEPYYKKLAGENVIKATSVYYDALLESVKKYAPEIVPQLKDNLDFYKSSFIIDEKKEANNIEYYLSTLKYQHDITSGDFNSIPKSLEKKYKDWEKISDHYQKTREDLGKKELDSLSKKVINSRNSFFNALREEYEIYRKNGNKQDITFPETTIAHTTKENDSMIGKVKNSVSDLLQRDNKRQKSYSPVFTTVNGDMVHYAEIQKKDGSWYFQTRIEDHHFSVLIDKKDLKQARQTLKRNPLELMEKYFPKEVMPKVAAEKFMLPLSIDIGTGKKEILHRLNLETMMDQDNPLYGKKVVSIQIGKKNMEFPVSRIDAEDFFNRLISANDLVTKVIANFKSVKINNKVKDGEISLGSYKISKMEEQPNKQSEKRPPQMITVNGDRVSHAHVFKSNTSDDWFFTAKINGEPLRPVGITRDETDGFFNKSLSVQNLMEKYYPSKLMPKVNSNDLTVTHTFKGNNGQSHTVEKFNVYKEKDQSNQDYGKYKFYAVVDGQKMSMTAPKSDLNAFFDKVMTPAQLVVKNFGDRLNLKEHYEQFKLPEGVDTSKIHIMKNKETNFYEISANFGEGARISGKALSYNDRTSFFATKTATKEQLAAKYLGNEISAILPNLKTAATQKVERQPSLSFH